MFRSVYGLENLLGHVRTCNGCEKRGSHEPRRTPCPATGRVVCRVVSSLIFSHRQSQIHQQTRTRVRYPTLAARSHRDLVSGRCSLCPPAQNHGPWCESQCRSRRLRRQQMDRPDAWMMSSVHKRAGGVRAAVRPDSLSPGTTDRGKPTPYRSQERANVRSYVGPALLCCRRVGQR
jgi:hypothetical protein